MALEQSAGHLAHRHRVIDHQHQQRSCLFAIDRPQGNRPAISCRLHGMARLQSAQLGQQIENQDNAAISQNGSSGQALYRIELRAQALDHDFTGAGHRIHLNGELLVMGVHQQDG
ncbi:hypothetical protein D3C80_1651660 [compost metagenome]